MKKRYARDLDHLLKLLFEAQYSEFAKGHESEDPLSLHGVLKADFVMYLSRTKRTIFIHKDDKGDIKPYGKTPSMQYGRYAVWQLEDDGLIETLPVDQSDTEYVVLTNKGRNFCDAGGYLGQWRRNCLKTAWAITKTTAATLNALAIVWLTWSALKYDGLTKNLENQTGAQTEAIVALTRENMELRMELAGAIKDNSRSDTLSHGQP